MSRGKHLNGLQLSDSVQRFTPEDYIGDEHLADDLALLKISIYRSEQSRRLIENSPKNRECCLYDF